MGAPVDTNNKNAKPPLTVSPMRAHDVPCYSTETLFRGDVEILLDHGGVEYRLRVTRSGRLILTK